MNRIGIGWLLLALGGAAQAAVEGEALQRTFTAYELQVPETHLGLAIDREGRLFAGTLDGVLVYAGQRWERVEIPNKIARQVDTGGDGRVYVGGINTLGVMERNDDGAWRFRELLAGVGVDPSRESIGHVSHIEPVPGGIVAVAQGTAIEVQGDTGSGRRWTLPEGVGRLLDSDGTLHTCLDTGLVRFVDEKPVAVPGGEAFAGVRCVALDSWNGRTILISDAGLHALSEDGLEVVDDGSRFAPLGPLTNRAVLADGGRVFGFLDGSLLHYDANASFVRSLKPVSSGVRDLVADHEGGLWVAKEGGLSRLDFPSPWSLMGSTRGLTGTTNDAAWYRGSWWVAGAHGLFEIKETASGRAMAERVAAVPEGELFSTIAGRGGLLLGAVDGLLVWAGEEAQARWLVGPEPDLAVDALKPSRFTDGRAYAAGVDSLMVLADEEQGWRVVTRIAVPGLASWAVAETAEHELWVGLVDGRVERFRFTPDGMAIAGRRSFGPEDGLPGIRDRWVLSVYDGALIAVAGGSAWRLDGERFVTFAAPTLGARTLAEQPKLVDTQHGRFAAGREAISVQDPRTGGWRTVHFAGLPVLDVNEIRQSPSQVAAVLLNGVLLYSAPAAESGSATVAPLAISLGWARTRGDGGQRVLGDEGALRMRSGEVLEVGVEAVRLGSDVTYRYRAPGALDEWSPWSATGTATVPVLRHSSVSLEVEARADDGATASLRRSVVVTPRWHERVDVQLGLGFVGMALLALIAKWISDYRLRAQRSYARELEATIARRTHEVAEAQNRLEASRLTDPVTEVPNRAAMEKGLAREWIRCMDTSRPMAVILIDIDHFGQINEEKGYLGGDEVLRKVSYKLQTLYDPQRELLARYDGARFVLLIPGISEEEARRRAKAIRDTLAGSAEETSSLGVAVVNPTTGSSPDVVMTKAEGALRQARNEGQGGLAIITL